MGEPDNRYGNQRFFGVAQPATGNHGFGQATASGATAATGGPVQGASLTTGMGINVVGVQGSVGDPRFSPTHQQVRESAVFGVAQPAKVFCFQLNSIALN